VDLVVMLTNEKKTNWHYTVPNPKSIKFEYYQNL